jgi:choline dehydrogenase-like flavoprotein
MAVDYDAIVVGSGITGGWAAKELTERGLRVLMLERGKPLEHGAGYTGEHKAPHEFPFRGLGDRKLIAAHYSSYAEAAQVMNEATQHFWARDDEIPYQQDPEAPFTWVRTNVLGGKSLVWGRQTYRWGEADFEANARDGHGIDWPIRYEDLAPWYDHVEEFIGVSGQAEALPQLPDGRFLPPMELNCVEESAKARIEEAFPSRRMTIGRVGILTRDHQGRQACHYCGPCYRGCSTASYFSTQGSTLPAAEKTGRLEVRTNAIVEKVTYDARTRRATGVHVIDSQTNERRFFSSKLVFLCASTMGTTQILLNSRDEHAPDGLANSSGALGRYLMDHTMGAGAFAIMPGHENVITRGHRPNGIYIPRFRNLPSNDESSEVGFVRGYGYQGMAMRLQGFPALAQPGFGADWKKSLTGFGPWAMFLAGFGECLPRETNRIKLSERHRDRWGIPQIDVRFEWAENELAMYSDIGREATAMLEAAGGVHVSPLGQTPPPGGVGIHEMGTARMGRDPRTSVLGSHCQAHDVPNLFVTDGACMTSSACQNPSLTYMALTARACAYAVDQLARGVYS